MLQEIDEKNFIDLTTDWLRENYEKMNAELFDGKLGNCDFDIFTTGRGSEGRILGWFCMMANGLFISKYNRRIYKKNPYEFDGKTYVTKENFYELTRPMIKLNGNYRWTEKAALSTLVHEMCHYYCNQDGWRPTQAHGYEFRSIASRVSMKSGKIFTVERIAKAEQMGEMELNSDMQAKKNKRIENKIKKVIPLLLWMDDGQVRLINCSSERLLDSIISTSGKHIRKAMRGDAEFAKFLFNNRYGKAMTTYRFWDVTGKSWLDELNKFNMQEIQILSTRRTLNEDIEKVLDEILNEEDEEIPIRPGINLGIVNEDADKEGLNEEISMRTEDVYWGTRWYFDDVEGRYRFALYKYHVDPSRMFLANVFVKEEERGKGLGNEILQKAEDIARKSSDTLFLKTKNGSKTHEWYKRHGFEDFQKEGSWMWMKKNIK